MKHIHIAAVAGLFLLASCGRQAGVTRNGGDDPVPGQELKDFVITDKKDGLLSWTLESPSAEVMEKDHQVLLDAPRVRFYREGEYVSTLVAERGRVRTDTNDLWGEGECVLDTAKGERMVTRDLRYVAGRELIVTDRPVTLTRKNETVYGTGLEATPGLEVVRIRNQRVVIRGSDGAAQ